jgi:hypothetical protein
MSLGYNYNYGLTIPNLTTSNFVSTNITVNNVYYTGNLIQNGTSSSVLGSSNNFIATNLSAGTLNAGNLTTGNINFTGTLSQNGTAYLGSQWTTTASNLSYTSGNVIVNNLTTGNLNFTGNLFQNGVAYVGSQWTSTAGSSLSYTSGNVVITNLVNTNASIGNISSANISISGNMTVGGNLLVAGSLISVNVTSNNIIDNNISAGTLNSVAATIGNLNSTNVTTNSLIATTVSSGSISTPNSTIGNLNSTNVTTNSLIATTVSSGSISTPNSTIGNLNSTNVTTNSLIATTVSSGSISTPNSTIVNLNTTNITSTNIFTTGFTSTNLLATNNTLTNTIFTNFTVGTLLANNLNLGSVSMFSGSFSASNNQASAAAVTGLIFNSSNVNYFECILTVGITTSVPSTLNAVYTIRGNYNASGWAIAVSYIGDNTGITFSINSSTGQISYTSTNVSFWTSDIFRFRVEQMTSTGTYTSLISGATTSNYSFSTLQILSTTDALPNGNIGALQVAGGVTIAKELFVGGTSFFNTAGSLGINTTNISYTLDVSGASRITTINTSASLTVSAQNNASSGGAQSTNGSLFLGYINNLTSSATVNFDLSTYLPGINPANLPTTRFNITDLGNSNNSFNILTRTAGAGTGSMASRIFIDGSGNVGIANTNPAYTLDVAGTTRIIGSGTSQSNGSLLLTGGDVFGHTLCIASSSNTNKRTVLNHTGTTGNLFSYDYSALTPQNLCLQFPGGNVGIGTVTPSVKLDLGTTAAAQLLALFNNNAAGGYFGFGAINSTNYYMSGLHHQFYTGSGFGTTGTSVMYINSSGQVGIGTTSPSFTLDISGTTRITGTITSGSHLISSGSLFIQNKISSLGYQYNVNTTNGNNITTDLRVINKRIKSSRANAVSTVTNWTRQLMAGSGPWAGIIWSPELGLFAAVLATTSTSAIQTSPDGIVWTTRTTPNLAYTGPIIWISELGIFVTGTSTNLNAIVTSTNGITWTAQTTPTTAGATAYAISWSPELYQITMTLGGTYILYSQNGTTWNSTTIAGTSILVHCWSSELNLFIGAQYANGTFGFAYSSNGISWTSTTALNSTNWLGICYSPELGMTVAVSQSGTSNNVAISRDGINWTLTTGVTGSPLLSNIIWAPEISLFVICQQGGGVWISPDGYTWTNRLATTNSSASAWSPELSIFCVITNGTNSAFTSNINYVTPQNTGQNIGTLKVQNKISSLGYQYNVNTTNGNNITTDLRSVVKRVKTSRANANNSVNTWTARIGNLACQGICWSSELGLFAATNYNAATTSAIQTSPDGIIWTTRTTPSIATLSYITWSPELTLFVATSYQAGTSSIITSPDGITWTSRTTPTFTGNGWQNICWSAELGLFVVVLGSLTANTSWIMTSSNGTTWTAQTTPSGSGWYGVCWAAELGLFVACSTVTSTNCIATSPNGVTWTAQTTPNIGIYDVKWSPELGLLVGISNTNSCITSPDAINWTSRTTVSGTWNQLVWSSELSLFAACQTTISTSAIMTSHDGINWIARTTPSTQLWGICYSPELSIFAAVNPFSATGLITSTPKTIPGIVTMNFGDTSCGQTSSLIAAMSSQLFSGSAAGVSSGVVTPSITTNGTDFGCLYKNSPGQFDFWRTYINLISGTYTFRIDYAASVDRGIVTVVLNGSSVGTVDTYAASNSRNIGTITGITISNSANYKVELQMNTKNASSTNYYLIWTNAAFIRTA